MTALFEILILIGLVAGYGAMLVICGAIVALVCEFFGRSAYPADPRHGHLVPALFFFGSAL
jgi:hypothetical protein